MMLEARENAQTPAVHVAGPIYEWELPDVELSGVDVVPALGRFSGPDGASVDVAAYRAGERSLVRLAAYAAGEWQWRIGNESNRGSLSVAAPTPVSRWPRASLRLSADRRHLIYPDGTPFFYMADTAWFIVWKGTEEQWARYLDQRAELGFSVIQVHLLPFRWELTDVEGNHPFVDQDPARPNDAYFRRVERFCEMAAERGLFVFMALMWGAVQPRHIATRFSTEQAAAYARYAVTRFGAYSVLWSLAGDDDYTPEIAKWEAMGQAVEDADAYGHPTTNHLPPRLNWYFAFHESTWHDFHMLQTGHRRGALADISDLPRAYYDREPVKPVVNGEPWYEAHPSRDTQEYGPVFTPDEARYAFWTSVLSGATMGHTYGSQGIWNWKRQDDGDEPLGGPGVGPVWSEALGHLGALHCARGARLLRTLPWWQLRPCPERIEIDPRPYGNLRPACARVPGQTWIAYLPAGSGTLTLKGLEALDWQAKWVDPRSGEETGSWAVETGADRKWRAPSAPSAEDWVLVLTAKG